MKLRLITKFYLGIVFFLIIVSCNRKEKLNYYYFTFLKDEPNYVNIEGEFKNGLETGKWRYILDNGKVYSEGSYKRGFKIGKWKYFFPDTLINKETIDWKIHNLKNQNVSLNIPESWSTVENNKRFFQASFNPELKNAIRYFVILKHNLDSMNTSLKGYSDFAYKKLKNNTKIMSKDFFKIKNGNKVFYYTKCNIVREKQDLTVGSFLFKKNNNVYDVTYSVATEKAYIKEIIFFDIIRSLRLNNERILNPYKEIKLINK